MSERPEPTHGCSALEDLAWHAEKTVHVIDELIRRLNARDECACDVMADEQGLD